MEMLITVIGILLTGVFIMAVAFFVKRALASREAAAAPNWGQRRYARNTSVLWVLILLALVYGSLIHYTHTLTGIVLLDGSIGLALGLYICSHPAANAVNALFFERDSLRQLSEWSVVRWLALNLLVLLAGWMVIFVGLRRLVDRAI